MKFRQSYNQANAAISPGSGGGVQGGLQGHCHVLLLEFALLACLLNTAVLASQVKQNNTIKYFKDQSNHSNHAITADVNNPMNQSDLRASSCLQLLGFKLNIQPVCTI